MLLATLYIRTTVCKGPLHYARKFLLMISAIFVIFNSIPAIYKHTDNK